MEKRRELKDMRRRSLRGTRYPVRRIGTDDGVCGYGLCERVEVKLQESAPPQHQGGSPEHCPAGQFTSRVKTMGEWSEEVQIGGSKKTTVCVANRYLTTSKPQSSTAKTGATAGGTSTVAADGTVTVPDSLKAYVDKAYQVGMDPNWKYAGMSAINSGCAVFYQWDCKPEK